jgi:hypothetical protein
MKKLYSILLSIILVMLLPTLELNAQAPFITRSPNRYGEYVLTQDAYEPVGEIRSFGNQDTLLEPKDMFIDDMDFLYVLDSGKKRVLVFDDNYEFVTSFGEDRLLRPLGIFVRDGLVYIADYGLPEDTTSGRVHVYHFDHLTSDATHQISHARPSGPVLEINQFIYRPQKIAVDLNHTMYVVSEGSYHGVLIINQANRFLSFFAPNRVQGNLMDRVIQILYGNNENATVTKKIPPAPTSVFLDDSGYVYTVTQTTITGNRGDTLKKVNNGGINFFPDNMMTSPDFQSIGVGLVDNIYAMTRSGFIFEYDREGNLLFIFAGPSQGVDQIGLFQSASAIAVNRQGDLIVADEVTNNLHIFKPTRFASVVHEALGLYNQGKYTESEALWEEVLRYNALFDLAHKGIGLSYMMQGRFEEAMEKFEIANAKAEYSLAFWEVRNTWLLDFAGYIMIGLVAVYGVLYLISKHNLSLFSESKVGQWVSRIKHIKIVKELAFMTYFIKNPADAVYEVRSHKRVSVSTGFIYLILLIVIYMTHLLLTGLLFTPVVIERTVFIEELFKVLVPFVTFVLGNYLVSSLMEGEGTLKSIFINVLGSMIPVVLILPIMIVLSNILTYNESFIYQFGLSIMVAWSAVLLFFIIKDTHNYSVKETIYNLIMTVLMMIVMIIIAIMVYMMIMQVVEFVFDLFKEVVISV